MEAAQSIVELYEIISKLSGPIEAKKSVSNMLYLVICDLQEETKPVTAENIRLGLEKYAADFIEVAKANAA